MFQLVGQNRRLKNIRKRHQKSFSFFTTKLLIPFKQKTWQIGFFQRFRTHLIKLVNICFKSDDFIGTISHEMLKKSPNKPFIIGPFRNNENSSFFNHKIRQLNKVSQDCYLRGEHELCDLPKTSIHQREAQSSNQDVSAYGLKDSYYA